MGMAGLVVLLERHGFMGLAQRQFYLVVVYGNGANGVPGCLQWRRRSPLILDALADISPPLSSYSLACHLPSLPNGSCDGWILTRGACWERA